MWGLCSSRRLPLGFRGSSSGGELYLYLNVVPLAKSRWVLYHLAKSLRPADPACCHWRWVNNFGMHCTVSIWSNLCSKVGHCIVLASIYLTKEVNKVPSL